MHLEIKKGDKFRHFKGTVYTVIALRVLRTVSVTDSALRAKADAHTGSSALSGSLSRTILTSSSAVT